MAFLRLLADDATATRLVDGLREATTVHQKAKDILRASRLPLLPVDNKHVANDLIKIRDGEALSPILVVRGDIHTGSPLQIADGYHRVCASYYTDENTDIPCRVANLGA
ncbi:MAG: hypothetical protein FWD75_08600 [Propionibacteriaceae bacterium]|nr:hypothetical protein [Propionibacteriaceae bacterium]